jgi:beta-glucosidase/6-phospho-beta-glucosidase/beta-galactosidase
MGGFECSTHRLRSGRRLDLIAATRHDELALSDYRLLADFGMRTARDGIRWHLIEPRPRHYDFSSVLPMIRAARQAGVEVIWDLFHYGWPDDIKIFKPEFVTRFGLMARAFAKLLREEMETESGVFVCPTNEISFLSWAGGDAAFFNPFARRRGNELKRQLVRANIEACEAVLDVIPGARLCQIDPVINIIADPKRPQDRDEAEAYRMSQYEAWDMIGGRANPELGGNPKYLDIIGVNYYSTNQWMHESQTMNRFHPKYKKFRLILEEVHARYQRPLFIAETGIEDNERPAWLEYMCGEAFAAIKAGVPVEGLCWYPILNYPGWNDERHCQAGLWDYAKKDGSREIFEPLAEEYRRQMQLEWRDKLWVQRRRDPSFQSRGNCAVNRPIASR